MKLAFGKALVNDAPLLVLDEPTNTLDVPSASELRTIVRNLNDQGKTVIYTTHIMSEAETLCDRVAIIDRGQLLALGTVSELKTSLQQDQVTHFEGVISAQAESSLRKIPEVLQTSRATQDGKAVLTVVSAAGQSNLPRLIDTLTQQGAMLAKDHDPGAHPGRCFRRQDRPHPGPRYFCKITMAMRTLNTQANISAMLASTRMRLQFLSRYPGQLVMDLVLPIVLAAMPIFLGRAGGCCQC